MPSSGLLLLHCAVATRLLFLRDFPSVLRQWQNFMSGCGPLCNSSQVAVAARAVDKLLVSSFFPFWLTLVSRSFLLPETSILSGYRICPLYYALRNKAAFPYRFFAPLNSLCVLMGLVLCCVLPVVIFLQSCRVLWVRFFTFPIPVCHPA